VAQMANGSVVAWGSNEFGSCDVPGLPAGLAFSRPAAGVQHSLGLCTDGSLVGWGQNGVGECDAPPLPAGFGYAEVAAGREFTVARVDSHDCNGNGLDDPLDLGAGTSADC